MVNTLDRRNFLKHLGVVGSYLLIGVNSANGKTYKVTNNNIEKYDFNSFVKISNNGDVVIIAHRSEMGQGVRTSLPSVVADELEADWNKITVEQGLGDSVYGSQNTDGSRSIRRFYDVMRKAGASAKYMLIAAAAKKWNVPESDCYAENHFVYHKNSKKKYSYGELVEKASTLKAPSNPSLKTKKEFKYIGKSLKSIDLDEIVSGNAQYGIDIELPNMLYAAIRRSPVVNGKVKKFDATETLKLNGVKKVIEIKRISSPFSPIGGIAVLGNNTWSVEKGKSLLKIDWDYGSNSKYDSSEFMKKMEDSVKRSGSVVKSEGNINTAFLDAHSTVESVFHAPHLAHATMETPNATALVKNNKCEIWAPTQDPQKVQEEVAGFLGISKNNVTVHVTMLGGGFGRKSKPDFILEAVALSKEVNSPVKVTWSREDDIQHDFYHTVSTQYLKASLDKKGNVTGWLHRAAYPTIASTFMSLINKPQDFEMKMGMTNLPYDIENICCEVTSTNSHVRIGWYRAVCNVFHSFAVNVFIDELAVKSGKDPLDFRLNLLGRNRQIKFDDSEFYIDIKRLKNVLSVVAKNANWGKKLPENHGIGLAVHYSFYSYVANIVEVSMEDDTLEILKVYSVVDCGTVVNKDTVKAQIEGGTIFGISLANYGNITAKDGKIEQSNFHDYQMLRMNSCPEIHVEIVDNEYPPTGVGEPGVPPVAPAIVNAIFNATGKRYYNLPLKNYEIV